MKTENQVCTVEQAKRLHELGVDKHNSFLSYWPNPKVLDGGAITPDGTYEILPTTTKRTYASAVKDSAFTVAELGIMLPYDNDELFVECYYSPHGGSWEAYLKRNINDNIVEMAEREGETEAEAKAELLIVLLETEDVTAKQVNERLLNE